uniref:Tonsoku-like protein n=1 Tax=Sinocyclocheilus grahami TaxID=75366 RepID=A0A672P2H5_SINGR
MLRTLLERVAFAEFTMAGEKHTLQEISAGRGRWDTSRHRQELELSEILHDVIGSAVANRKIGECYAELGNIEAALKHQRLHLNLARSVHDAAEEQRALATIGRTYLFLFDSDNSRDSLKHAEDAFKKSLAIVDERLEGTVSSRELSEMKARLLLNLGCVNDGMKEPQRCSDFIRQSIYIAEKNNLLEDLYRANFNLGSIHFRNGQHSRAMRCFEQSKECARKMKDKFSESECFHSIGKILLHLGDFAAARRALKKAFCLGSQQPSDREAVKRDFKHGEMKNILTDKFSHEALDLSEQLGDLYCKVGCYNKALEAYQAQLVCAEVLGKPARELAVIHVSLAATYTDLRQHHRAVEHYRQELKLREGNPKEECETWLNIAGGEEEIGQPMETLDHSFSAALSCAERSGQNKLQWNRRNEKGETVLHRACIEGNLKQVQYLLDQGHPVNLRDYCGWTALHEACNYGHEEIVAFLLDRGANINDPGGRDCEGVTPLHDTLNCGHFPVARLLVERGASVTVRNSKVRQTRNESSSSDHFDSDISLSPLRPVRSRPRSPAVQSSQEFPPSQDVPSVYEFREAVLPPQSKSGRLEYQKAMQNLGSAKSRLLSQSLSEPAFTSTPAVSANSRTALVPEDQYLADDWLEDDLRDVQPKKKRRVSEHNVPREITSRNQNHFSVSAEVHPRGADSCTVAWLCDQAAQRHYQTCGLLPRLSLQKEGALLLPTDPLLAVLHTNEEVVAEVCSWDLPPLPERYRKACQSLAVEENRRVSRLCEVQDSSSCVNVCGLCLPPASLTPLLRALKLQASLTELRISANRLNNDLLPELMSAAATMPRLRILDISANQITGEGLKKASDTFETKSQCLEELNLSMNPLGDGWTQALASLLSACPMLSALSLQACGLSARFFQQHRLLLANALASKCTGNMRSVCFSHNALGSTGFELVLKTLPMHCLTYLQLSAVCRGPSDQPAMEILTKLLTQGDCPLTHLNLAGNGLTDHSVLLLARCLPVCPSLVSLDLSGNPSVTSVGLQSLLNALMEAQRPLTHLSLQGCQVSGPLGDVGLDSLSDHIRDLRLCSQCLNKLDQDALQQSWRRRSEHVHVFSRNSKCMLSITAASQ